jgi:hypothetical protein
MMEGTAFFQELDKRAESPEFQEDEEQVQELFLEYFDEAQTGVVVLHD